ncbi:unnamed protein product [Amoebophrya sp. A120]|nr:unnamed protein product [Amoebophrya sp. A120]|eukprot:GSA120T00002992001.1
MGMARSKSGKKGSKGVVRKDQKKGAGKGGKKTTKGAGKGGKSAMKKGKGKGKKGKGKGKNGKPATGEDLDKQLAEYMGEDVLKERMDDELDNYMKPEA